MEEYKEIIQIIKQILIGGIASGIHYLYTVAKGTKFEWLGLALNMAIGSFTGWMVGQFLPADVAYHDGIIAIAGISAFQLIEIVEGKAGDLYKFINPFKK